MAKTKFGICKLTGDSARYVKSHIIPRSVTRLDRSGTHRYEAQPGRPPIVRHDSWFDLELVTAKGEEILTRHDTFGIDFLRRHGLIWSGWKGESALPIEFSRNMVSKRQGIRVVESTPEELENLRFFFLSILWRAGRSGIAACSQINLSSDEELELRKVTLGDSDSGHFPISVSQHYTFGAHINQSPVALDIPAYDQFGNLTGETTPIFRIYFDGLVVHFRRDWKGEPQGVGTKRASAFPVGLISFEGSWQHQNVLQVLTEMSPRRG